MFSLDLFLNTNVVQIYLLDAEIPGGGILSEFVIVRCRILKEGILPNGPSVIPSGLPLSPIKIVWKLFQFLIPRDEAPVDIVMKIWRQVVVSVICAAKYEIIIHIVHQVDVVKVLVLLWTGGRFNATSEHF